MDSLPEDGSRRRLATTNAKCATSGHRGVDGAPGRSAGRLPFRRERPPRQRQTGRVPAPTRPPARGLTAAWRVHRCSVDDRRTGLHARDVRDAHGRLRAACRSDARRPASSRRRAGRAFGPGRRPVPRPRPRPASARAGDPGGQAGGLADLRRAGRRRARPGGRAREGRRRRDRRGGSVAAARSVPRGQDVDDPPRREGDAVQIPAALTRPLTACASGTPRTAAAGAGRGRAPPRRSSRTAAASPCARSPPPEGA